MSFFKKNPLLTLGLLVLVLVGLPAAIFLSQKNSENRSKAAASVVLSFRPASSQSAPINVAPSGSTTLEIWLDPGTNIASLLKGEITYDATKVQAANGSLQFDPSGFPTVVQPPIYSSGKIQFVVSAGADPTKALQKPTKIGTLTLNSLPASGTSSTQVTFNSSNTLVLSIDQNSTPKENVLSSILPAFLQVSNGGVTVSPTTPPGSCSNAPSDTMLVIDKSGSMSTASTANKITQAKVAAKNYVDIISADGRNTIGLVSYENTATVNSPLTTNYSSVKTQIDSLTAIGSTCTECAILAANAEIAKSSTSNKKVVVLLTDGLANYIQGGSSQVDTALAEQKALAAAVAGHSAKGTVFYTIGLGSQINGTFLQQIAQQTGGQYFPSPTSDQLNTIYNQISQISGKGSVSGFVYNDANGNGSFNTGESKLSGWTLQLFPAGSTTPQTFTSDPNFGFNITGICDGNYTLKEVVQPGFRQTQPADPNGYSIVINNGTALTDKNFGNNQGNTCADHLDNNNNGLIDTQDPACHTDGDPDNPSTYNPDLPENGNTCADKLDNNGNGLIDAKDPICHTDGNPNNPSTYDPRRPETGGNGTGLNLTVFLHGIGNSGDNATTLSSLSNKNPLHPVRNTKVTIYNISNQVVASVSGQITYASSSGDYRGRVQTPTPLTTGSYNVRVGASQHLIRLVPGIQSINGTQDNALPVISVVAGDINDDNKLDIRDYNTLLDCYADRTPAPSCEDANKKVLTDLNDDGFVNGPDYNLFIRELSTQPGE